MPSTDGPVAPADRYRGPGHRRTSGSPRVRRRNGLQPSHDACAACVRCGAGNPSFAAGSNSHATPRQAQRRRGRARSTVSLRRIGRATIRRRDAFGPRTCAIAAGRRIRVRCRLSAAPRPDAGRARRHLQSGRPRTAGVHRRAPSAAHDPLAAASESRHGCGDARLFRADRRRPPSAACPCPCGNAIDAARAWPGASHLTREARAATGGVRRHLTACARPRRITPAPSTGTALPAPAWA